MKDIVMEPRISILMGIYNCADTLPEALDSVLAQTYTAWKMIMCDDGSTDLTIQVARKYKNEYPNKFVLIRNKKNMGLNYTLNHCLKYADTEYVARMDGDDISLPERFEKEIELLDSHPEYAFVSCPMIYFDDKGDFGCGKPICNPSKNDFIVGSPFAHAPCMVRTEAIKKVGGYSVSDKLLRVEDYHLWYKLYKAGYRGFNLEEPLYKMRDDRNAYHRRNYKNRINEAYVKWLILRDFHLPPYKAVYILRPLIVGLLPSGLYGMLHKKKRAI